jgi:surfactin synthase thioesterase subunit
MSEPTELQRRLAGLSPEKRALLEKRLAAAVRPGSIPRRSSGGPVPVSFSQRRLWFLDQMEPGNPAYNVFRGVALRGDLNVPALERSLGEIIRRHEILRTTFPMEDGEPVQCIHEPAPVALPVVDRSHVLAADHRAEAERIAAEVAAEPFDLSSDRLLKARLIRFSATEHILVLVMHHIAVDGWSVGIFFAELVALYDAFSHNVASPLPPLPIQFGDYAAWERSQLGPEKRIRLLEYWKGELAGVPPVLELPVDRTRPAAQTSHGARYYLQIPSLPAVNELKVIARRESATLYMALLAAFQVLLSRYAGQEQFAVGSPMACREVPELERLIGCFSNTLALRADLRDNPSFNELLRRVRETVVGGLAHELLPFDMLVEALHPKRDPSRTALVQVNFRLLTAPLPPATGGGLRFEFLEVDNRRCKFDLALELVEKQDGLAGYLEYNTDLFHPGTMPMIASDYEDLLHALAAAPDTPVADLAFDPRVGGRKIHSGPREVRRRPAYLRFLPAEAPPNPWISSARPKHGSTLRLFCLPYAGGDTSAFARWNEYLPPNIELFPISLPGRGGRLRESAFTSVPDLVEAMAHGLRSSFGKRFALLGISTGAILSFELARYLRTLHLEPAHLFACCCEAPDLPPARSEPIHDLPESEFLERVQNFGGTPSAALADPELRQLILPALRADFQLRDTYRFIPQPPLACPITVIGGAEDRFADRPALDAWRRHTSAGFEASILPGGHFFFNPDPRPLLEVVAQHCGAGVPVG